MNDLEKHLEECENSFYESMRKCDFSKFGELEIKFTKGMIGAFVCYERQKDGESVADIAQEVEEIFERLKSGVEA